MKLATLLLSFPLTTERFITQELLYLKDNGIQLELFPLRKKPGSKFPEEAADLMKNTHYLPFFSIACWLSLCYYVFLCPVKFGKIMLYLAYHLREPGTLVKLLYLLPKTALIARVLKKKGIKEVHAHWASLPATIARFVATLSGTHYHFSAHASDIFTYKNRFFLGQKIAGATFVITCSQYAREFLGSFCSGHKNKEKLFTVYHGIKPEEYKDVETCEMRPPLICSGGRLVKKKGLIYLIGALAQLRQKGIAFQAVIFGSGPEKANLLQEIKNQRLEKEVKITGFISHSELIDNLRQSSMFVLPAVIQDNGNREGLSNILLEAQALGKPVIATRLSAIPELVEDGYNGYLTPCGDTRALAQAMENLLNHQARRQSMGQRGQEKVGRTFNFYASQAHLVEIYHQFAEET